MPLNTHILACPKCKHPLLPENGGFRCAGSDCGRQYPVIDGRPILINEDNSVFALSDYQPPSHDPATPERPGLLQRFGRHVPLICRNWKGAESFRNLRKLLQHRDTKRVLIVGAGERGVGIGALNSDPEIELFRTDVYLEAKVDAVADAHDLPIQDDAFDAVVIQAVLEHVLDPQRCVDEIHRVLKPDGLVYSETPFLWPVHLGPYDFTRFSYSGHRRLFNRFHEIDSGMSAGPGVALALATRGVFIGLSNSRLMSGFVTYILPFLIFWMKHLDRFMLDKPEAADFGAAFYFMGKSAAKALPDEEILAYHWSRKQTPH